MNVLALPMCRKPVGDGAKRTRTIKLQDTGGRRQEAESRRQKAEGRKQKAESRRQKAEGRKQREGFTLAWVLLYSCGGVWRLAIGRILLFRLCRGSLRPKSLGRTTCQATRYLRRRTGATLCRIHERQPRSLTYRRRMVSVRRSRKNRLP